MQRQLWTARQYAEAGRDDLPVRVVAHLDDPEAILDLDETSPPGKGTRSAGEVRQYRGTAGSFEVCQIGVVGASDNLHGRAFPDRTRDLHQDWTNDRGRCRAASIPDNAAYATTVAVAQARLQRVRL